MKREVQGAVLPLRPPRLSSEIHVAPPCKRLRSQELLGDDGDLLIDHNGELYVLSSLPGGRLTLTGWFGAALRFIGNRYPSR